MRNAVIRIQKGDAEILRQAGEAFRSAWQGGERTPDLFTFSSPAQLFSVLTPRRWDLVERLQATGASSLRGLARALGRDVKRVHEDVAVLLDWGLIEKTDDGRIVVPYDVIHADFELSPAA
jgi:predicted transcriptional regulator